MIAKVFWDVLGGSKVVAVRLLKYSECCHVVARVFWVFLKYFSVVARVFWVF